MTMSKGETSRLTIQGFKGYGAGGFPAWGYPFLLRLRFSNFDYCALTYRTIV